jgi:hypothetical protein
MKRPLTVAQLKTHILKEEKCFFNEKCMLLKRKMHFSISRILHTRFGQNPPDWRKERRKNTRKGSLQDKKTSQRKTEQSEKHLQKREKCICICSFSSQTKTMNLFHRLMQ